MDMIDDALLRPGRLELHVEIGLPDLKGRTQILNIRIDEEALIKVGELAEKTKNSSGAELEELVRAATSYALTRCADVNDLSKPPEEKNLRVEFANLLRAFRDVQPKFGVKSTELKCLYRNRFVKYGETFDFLMGTFDRLVDQGKLQRDTIPTLSNIVTLVLTICHI